MGIQYLPVSQNDDGSIYIPIDASMSFDQVRPGVFLISSGNNSQLFYADYDTDGRVQAICAATHDYLHMSSVEFFFDILSFALLVIAVIYSFVYIIIALIRVIRKRKSPLNAWRLLLCGSILLTMVNLVIYVLNIATYASAPFSIGINGILFLLLNLVPVVFAIILAIKWKSLNLTKKEENRLDCQWRYGVDCDI